MSARDSRLELPASQRASGITEAVALARSGVVDVTILQAGSALETLRDVVRQLGGERDSGPFQRIRDIRFDPGKTHSIAESLAAHRDHTDGTFDATPPQYFALQYVQSDPHGGGVNTFKALGPIFERCPPELLAALETAEIRFRRGDDSGAQHDFTGPMLSRRASGGRLLRWRDDEQVAPEIVDGRGTPIAEAIGWLREQIRVAVGLSYLGEEADIVIVSNDSVTHGRTMLSPDSSRWMRRAWIA